MCADGYMFISAFKINIQFEIKIENYEHFQDYHYFCLKATAFQIKKIFFCLINYWSSRTIIYMKV